MSEITNLVDFKRKIQCCIELRIKRSKLGYYHHVFVGEVDTDGCFIYHYKSKSSLSFFSFSPAKITKVRLQYETYESTSEILSIFNFNNGDIVEIVDRTDYPKTEEKRKECIEKAESRLGETQYTASFNNCESYVNWIFSNDNSSKQASENYLTTLILDELSLTNVVSILLEDVPKIFPKVCEWIKKRNTYVNLEKYWNKFVEKIDEIADKILKILTNPGPFQRYLYNHLF